MCSNPSSFGVEPRPSGQPTKEQAKRYVAEVEARISRGQVGIEDVGDQPMFKPLFESFLEGITDRNADDDRSRGTCHVLPAFARRRLADVTLASVMEWIDDPRGRLA